MSRHLGSILVAIVSLLSVRARAEGPATQEALREGEARQQQIRSEVRGVAERIDTILEEFMRNGLGGEDVRVLEGIRSILGQLTQEQMQRVIAALQDARSAPDPDRSSTALASAVAQQKLIIVQLRQLLLAYLRQQELYQLSLRLSSLAQRQDGNLRQTVGLARGVEGRANPQLGAELCAGLMVQQAEQEAIRDEANGLVAKLEAMKRQAGGAASERITETLEIASQSDLKGRLEMAADQVKRGNLFGAGASQKAVRDALREMARRLARPPDPQDLLSRAGDEVQKAGEEQRRIISQTNGPKDGAPNSEIESREAELVDRLDATRKDVEGLAPAAGEALDRVVEHMQEARAQLAAGARDRAVAPEQQAMQSLKDATRLLQQQTAKTGPQTQPGDPMATGGRPAQGRRNSATKPAAQEREASNAVPADQERDGPASALLAERARKLEQQQRAIKEQVDRPQATPASVRESGGPQQQAQEAAKKLRDATASVSPGAAESLGRAAGQMERSEALMRDGRDMKRLREAQAAAVAELNEAKEELERQARKTRDRQRELNELSGARKSIGQLIREEQKVVRATARSAAQIRATQEPADKPTALGDQQGKVARDAQAIANELRPKAKASAALVEDARRSMEEARARLAGDKADDALPPEADALASLYRAQAAVDQRISELQGDKGDAASAGEDLAERRQKVEQIRRDVEAVSGQLGQGAGPKSPQQAASALDKAAEEAGEVAAEGPSDMPAAAAGAVQSATAALSDAAAAASAGNGGEAKRAAEQADEALARASAAMGLAGGLSAQPEGPNASAQPVGASSPGREGPPGQGRANEVDTRGASGNRRDGAAGATEQPAGQGAGGEGRYVGLPQRDRAAIQQSQGQRYPEEYAPLIEQYLRNLSDTEGR